MSSMIQTMHFETVYDCNNLFQTRKNEKKKEKILDEFCFMFAFIFTYFFCLFIHWSRWRTFKNCATSIYVMSIAWLTVEKIKNRQERHQIHRTNPHPQNVHLYHVHPLPHQMSYTHLHQHASNYHNTKSSSSSRRSRQN